MKNTKTQEEINIDKLTKIKLGLSGFKYRRENPIKKLTPTDNNYFINKEIPEDVLKLLKNFNTNIFNEYKIIRDTVDKKIAANLEIIETILNTYKKKCIKPSSIKDKKQKLELLNSIHEREYATYKEYRKIEDLLEDTILDYSVFIRDTVHYNNKFTPKVTINESFRDMLVKLNSNYKKITKAPLYIETINSNSKDKTETSVESLRLLNGLITKSKRVPTKVQRLVKNVTKNTEEVRVDTVREIERTK